MSVYTSLSKDDIQRFLSTFALGRYEHHRGISAGIENTNYFVTTSTGEYVLTVFEHQNANEVRALIRLAHHLAHKGLQVPAPILDTNQIWLHTLYNKPAMICAKLPGVHIQNIEASHCYAIGKALAQLHLAAHDLDSHRADHRAYAWWISAGKDLAHLLTPDECAVLNSELDFQTKARSAWQQLPHGWIHSDLFHDNALFENNTTVGAILDLYNASYGAWLYDLAVVANDWCSTISGEWKEGCVEALLKGYGEVRALNTLETQLWPTALRAGALRFWLSRLLTRQIQQSQKGELALQKDPNEYYQKLLQRRAQFAD